MTIIALLFCIPPMIYVRPPAPRSALHLLPFPPAPSLPLTTGRSPPLPQLPQFEGASLGAGIQAAISKVGAEKFYTMLVMVGAYYHLYNQARIIPGNHPPETARKPTPSHVFPGPPAAPAGGPASPSAADPPPPRALASLDREQVAYQALEKVEPITHAVGNVGKRIFVIGFSIIAFGNLPTTQTMIGSAIAIAGAGLYSYLKARGASRLSRREGKSEPSAPSDGRAPLSSDLRPP